MKNLLLGFLSNGAGIKQQYVGIGLVFSALIALAFAQHVIHTRRVVLIHLTAMSFYKKLFGHASHTNSGAAIIRNVALDHTLKKRTCCP